MKKNNALAIISILLLCSLALNYVAFRHIAAETEIAECKKIHIEFPENAEWLGIPYEMHQDWGTLQFDKSVTGNLLSIAGKYYEKGIGTHAGAILIYNLHGKYERLTAVLGLDDDADCSNGAQVKVFGDWELLEDSGELDYGKEFPLDVSLKGVQKLIFGIYPLGDKSCDHVDIAVPILYYPK